MKTLEFGRSVALTLASAGWLLSQSTALAGSPAETESRPAAVTAPVVHDVALANGGVLRGQVIDQQGAPLARTAVSVSSSGREVASTQTDTDGNFAVGNLCGGNYTVVAGEGEGAYRAWAEKSAPPQAQPGVLIVSGREVNRGQSGGGIWRRPGTLVALGIIGGIVAGGVISQQNSSGS